MGHVTAPFGVLGWIKVHPYTQTVESLLGYKQWWLGTEGQYQAYKVLEAQGHGKQVIARLEGVDDRDAAVVLRGLEVAVQRKALPKTRENEYYWTDLIGLQVHNTAGEHLGTVKNLLETGANDVLVLEGDRERLIPFVRQVILDVDLPGGSIQVEWGADY